MTNIYIHELLEAIVNPYGTAWLYNGTYSGIEDLCVFNYAAGDGVYCDLPSIYTDFPTNHESEILPSPTFAS